jgi:hypothetical protein
MAVTNWAIEYLLETQNGDGGWAAYPEGPSRTEPSALAVTALGLTPETAGGAGVTAGLAWLQTRQAASGGWPAMEGQPADSWMTSLATLAVSHLEPNGEAARRGADWVLRQEGQTVSWWVKLLARLRPQIKTVELDLDLIGWPWTEGTFSWIEPTAYALLALKRLRPLLPAGTAAERIDLGERMIIDRACRGGGWNYGNSVVLGEELWPYPDTTALALLALQGRPAAEIETGLTALSRMLEENRSLLAASLATLCFRAYGRSAETLRAELAARAGPETAMFETRPIALAALALVDGPAPWRVEDDG